MLGQIGHRRLGNGWKCPVRLRQNQQFIDAANALGGNKAKLGKMAARAALTLMARCLTSNSRVLCSIGTAC